MESATDEKSLEKRLKVAALAWACTLTPPTGLAPPEPPLVDGSFRYYLRDLEIFARLLNAKPHNANSMPPLLRRGRDKTKARRKGQQCE